MEPTGRACAEGGPGTALSFVLRLPRAPREVVQASVANEAKALPETLRVLVADDMLMNRKLLKAALLAIRPKWTVTMATSAEEAVELVLTAPNDAPFELICMDEDFSCSPSASRDRPAMMRGSEGIARIREHERTCMLDLPAAIVSISGDPAAETHSTQIRIWGKPYPSVTDGSMQKELKRLLQGRLKSVVDSDKSG